MPKYVLAMSVMYLFDASMLPFSTRGWQISFPTLTALYVVSIIEVSAILHILFSGRNKSLKYSSFQSR